MRIITTVEPLIEPVTLDEAKKFTRVDLDDDDDLIEMFITAARLHVEQYCNISLITQTKTVFYDAGDLCPTSNSLLLPFSPVQSIEGFNSVANDNVELEFPAGDYFLSGARVALNSNAYWPSNVRSIDAYNVTAVVGYGDDAFDVPTALKHAILRLVAHFYQNREAVYDSVNGINVPSNVPYSVTCALMPYRVFVI